MTCEHVTGAFFLFADHKLSRSHHTEPDIYGAFCKSGKAGELDKVKSAEQRGEGEGEGGSDKTSSASFKILKLYGNVSTNSASC